MGVQVGCVVVSYTCLCTHMHVHTCLHTLTHIKHDKHVWWPFASSSHVVLVLCMCHGFVSTWSCTQASKWVVTDVILLCWHCLGC